MPVPCWQIQFKIELVVPSGQRKAPPEGGRVSRPVGGPPKGGDTRKEAPRKVVPRKVVPPKGGLAFGPPERVR